MLHSKKRKKENWLFIVTQKQASQKLYARIKHTLQSLSRENFSKTNFYCYRDRQQLTDVGLILYEH